MMGEEVFISQQTYAEIEDELNQLLNKDSLTYDALYREFNDKAGRIVPIRSVLMKVAVHFYRKGQEDSYKPEI